MSTQFSKLYQEATLYKAWNEVKSKGSDTKRRNRVVRIMESLGTRMNFSVFE